ncbi:MAG: M15 family metallopeptidase [Faecalibacterium sp.]
MTSTKETLLAMEKMQQEREETSVCQKEECAAQADPFELSVVGATAFVASYTPIFYMTPEKTLRNLAAEETGAFYFQGTPFTILAEVGAYWQVRDSADGSTGFVPRDSCLINLPDVLPSAIYCNTNAEASRMRSCGKEIPGVTGEQLYSARVFNNRLGREEYIMPVLYATAKKIAAAHKAALAQGDALVIYELFRMQAVQQRVVRGLWALAEQDSQVMQGITGAPWEMDWFIATGISTHQRGMAMDVGLAKVNASEALTLPGGMQCTQITDYTLHPMPTPIHELSPASASMAYPVTSRNDTDWRSTPLAPNMTEGARRLRDYCTGAGLTPLASEWWHFNDLEAEQILGIESFLLPTAPESPFVWSPDGFVSVPKSPSERS